MGGRRAALLRGRRVAQKIELIVLFNFAARRRQLMTCVGDGAVAM